MRKLIQNLRERTMSSLVFLTIACFLLWEPDFIKVQNGLPDDLFDIGGAILLLFLIILYIADLKNQFSVFDLFLALLGGVLIFSTWLHAGIGPEMWKCLKYIWPAAAMVLLVEQAVKIHANKTAMAFYLMCFINTAINAVTMIFFPEGIYPGHETIPEPQYWLGNENVFIITLLAGLGVGYITVCARGKRITWDYVAYIILCVACARWSATSMIGLGVFLLLWLAHFFIRPSWVYNPFLYEGVAWAGFFSIVVFHVQNLFSFFIINILHKDLTLTFRTKLWRRVLRQFKESPWLGYGVRDAIAFSDSVGGKRHWVHAHNYVLDLLNKGGLLAVIPFAAALLVTAGRMLPHLSKACVRILSVALLAYLIVFIGDCFEMRTPFYGLLAFCVQAQYLP